ncbi:hypothetical protein LR48_Vigan04g154800 [Vigna angularis]|uniref:Uncharacterized protein n=1 Tax=Phaseolus angularis TaxID=3914 RepID=A0A0L9UEJ2_PHAAN|nr:hypothetical protein LR48_Vigan04g154800 [Vigna angularis]
MTFGRSFSTVRSFDLSDVRALMLNRSFILKRSLFDRSAILSLMTFVRRLNRSSVWKRLLDRSAIHTFMTFGNSHVQPFGHPQAILPLVLATLPLVQVTPLIYRSSWSSSLFYRSFPTASAHPFSSAFSAVRPKTIRPQIRSVVRSVLMCLF